MKKNKEIIKIMCPTCGDVTKGHPEEDKLLCRLLENGFSSVYTGVEPTEDTKELHQAIKFEKNDRESRASKPAKKRGEGGIPFRTRDNNKS